jgi:hypothetical protein
MAQLLTGLELGDPLIDGLDASVVSPCATKAHENSVAHVPQNAEPDWVNWRVVRRGQALWRANLGRVAVALLQTLLQGFTIARFGVVLHHAGYAQSVETTFKRYRDTAFFIVDWFDYPLDDPRSRSRVGISRVRCMHSFARRRSTKLFDRAAGEGTPLSQYDMGEVLLGFSAVCLAIMEHALGLQLTEEERGAMVATWRLIGHHLGIRDEYNVCASLARLDACFADYMEHTPQRLRTCREATHALQAPHARPAPPGRMSAMPCHVAQCAPMPTPRGATRRRRRRRASARTPRWARRTTRRSSSRCSTATSACPRRGSRTRASARRRTCPRSSPG